MFEITLLYQKKEVQIKCRARSSPDSERESSDQEIVEVILREKKNDPVKGLQDPLRREGSHALFASEEPNAGRLPQNFSFPGESAVGLVADFSSVIVLETSKWQVRGRGDKSTAKIPPVQPATSCR